MSNSTQQHDLSTVIEFAKRAGITQVIRASELPEVLRYPNAAAGDAPATAEEADRLLRYAHHLLDEFPGETDERPARALANYRSHFAPHVYALRHEIARWKADPKGHQQRRLTDILWHVGDQIHKAHGEGESPFFEFNQFRKPYLRFGLLTLAKVLCREIDTQI